MLIVAILILGGAAILFYADWKFKRDHGEDLRDFERHLMRKYLDRNKGRP